QDLPELTIKQILAWVDAHFERHGRWPTKDSGPVEDSPGNTWAAVNIALWRGLRGLKGGSSLARLLAERRGVRNRHVLPKFSTARILAWCDAHHRRTGKWPNSRSGAIQEMPADTWAIVDGALREGLRGLRGGSSLARLLERERGVLPRPRPPLSVDQVLEWADAHYKRHAAWPSSESGPVKGTLGETWATVDAALSRGRRGLPSRLSLARLLAERRGVPTPLVVPKFSTADVLAWADAHHQRTGMWPKRDSGPVQEMPGVTWAIVNRTLQRGQRNRRGRSSLAKLLERERDVLPKQRRRPPLAIENILAWADAHHRRTGQWPKQSSGKIPEAQRESWEIIDSALRKGSRGLPQGLALGKLWAQYRGARNVHSTPKLSAEQILKWADAHYRRTGSWPQVRSGTINESPADNWLSVENALRVGLRGLPGGSSLKRFLDEHRRNGEVTLVIATKRPLKARQRAARITRRKPLNRRHTLR
ncbi:MAG: hypothetical protein ACREHD_13895, partial [Pirellulales bacterium]